MSEFAGSSSSNSPRVFAPGTLLQTGAPRWFCCSIIFFLLSLFAQRLGAIIGANTPHCSYLCTHAGAQKTSARKCAPQADTYVDGCTAPSCTAAANTQWLPLPSASVLCLSLSGGPWPPTAGGVGGSGGVSERCDSVGKVQDNKSVSRSVSAPFLPSIYQISSCNLA